MEKKFKACFLRKLFTGSEKWSMENCFVKDQFFVKKFTFWAKAFFKLAEKFQKCYQNCILHAQWSFFWFLKYFKFLIFFGLEGAKTFWLFVTSLFGTVVKIFFYVPTKTLWGKWIVSKKECLLIFFGVWAEVFRTIGAIFRGMDFKSEICMSRIKFRGEVFFGNTLSSDTLEFWAEFFQGFGEKKHKQCCQNCILRV